MKIGIIGSGISGLVAAYLLQPQHDVTVYEQNDYVGGHSRTIEVDDRGRRVPVDTGFIVYNERNYPLLTKLFRHLGVDTLDSDMSFGVSVGDGWLEYGSKGLFAQTRNLVRPDFWRMLGDTLRFNRRALALLGRRDDLTLRKFLVELDAGEWFRRYYLQAMGAAIWSCSVETILDYPAQPFLQFFENHGLLTINGHPQWRTVKGGSRAYVEKLTAGFRDHIHAGRGARRVRRQDGRVSIEDAAGDERAFDHVIFACHADQALALLNAPSAAETEILGAFRYQANRAVTHRDASFMPKRRACWSSWVYLAETRDDVKDVVSLSYWMNRLQSLETELPVIVTLNPAREPDPALVVEEHMFDHPVFTLAALRAQRRIDEIQGAGNVWHCGAYQRHGFHEDGLMSGVAVAQRLGAVLPW